MKETNNTGKCSECLENTLLLWKQGNLEYCQRCYNIMMEKEKLDFKEILEFCYARGIYDPYEKDRIQAYRNSALLIHKMLK